jgi:hypothetical protein
VKFVPNRSLLQRGKKVVSLIGVSAGVLEHMEAMSGLPWEPCALETR